MRMAPPSGMLARKSSRKLRKPFAASARGEYGGRPQSWPLGLNSSGGVALGIKLVGRPAAGGIERVRLLVGPDLGAAAIGTEREVHVQTDRHAELAGAALHGAELRARRLLQPL